MGQQKIACDGNPHPDCEGNLACSCHAECTTHRRTPKMLPVRRPASADFVRAATSSSVERDAFLAGMDAGWALGRLGAGGRWLDEFQTDLALEWGFTEPFSPSHPIWEEIKGTRAWAARLTVLAKLQ